MKETLDAIRTALKERVGSQVVGTFVLIWLVFNWPIFVLLWKSQLPIELTLWGISSERLTFHNSFLMPAICTALYILIYPWISYVASTYSDWANTRAILKRQKWEVKILKGKTETFEVEADLDMIKADKKRAVEHRIKQFEIQQQRVEREQAASLERHEKEIQAQQDKQARQLEEDRKREDENRARQREEIRRQAEREAAKRKIDDEVEVREYRVQKEKEARQRHGGLFDQTKPQ